MNKDNNNKTIELDCTTLQSDPRLKKCDNELVSFIQETFDWKFNNELTPYTVNHAISYLDSLCSLPISKLGRNDKQKVAKTMELVLNKTVELLAEARQ